MLYHIPLNLPDKKDSGCGALKMITIFTNQTKKTSNNNLSDPTSFTQKKASPIGGLSPFLAFTGGENSA